MSQVVTKSKAVASEASPPARGITLRAACLGLLMIVLLVGMTQVLCIRQSAAEIAGNAPPPAPTYLLLLYVLLVGPLLSRLGRRLSLSRSELLLIYVMMLIAGPIMHEIGIGFFLPHIAAPAYYVTQYPQWIQFWPGLPAWLGPRDYDTVAEFFRGTRGPIPWLAWAVPLLAWASLLAALFFVMLCLNVLMRKQYIEYERLTFPLTAIPLALTEEPARILRQGLFWLGLAVPLLVQAPAALNRYFPTIPALRLQEVLLVDASVVYPHPWNGLGQLYFSLTFWLVGIVYLIPKEIAFSAWFFYFLALLQNVFAVMSGQNGETPSVYSNDFPALYAQGAGAALALTGITLYAARRHLREVARKVFLRDPTVDDRGEFLSYRTAVWGTVLGGTFILAWCCVAGMHLWVAAVLFGLVLAYFFIFARVRAETGLGMGVILWPKMADEMMTTIVGARFLSLSDLTVIFALRWLYFTPAIGSVMACQLEGFKLLDTGGLRGRGVGWLLTLAAVFALLLAMVWTLKTYYRSGFELLPIGQHDLSMVASQSYWSYQNLITTYNTPRGPEWGGICAIGVGALVTIILSSLRMNFLGFPLHPVGYLAANSWGMHLNWFSFFLGWLIKALVTRYGGLKVYRQLLTLFLGMIVGDMVHQGIWGLVAWAAVTHW